MQERISSWLLVLAAVALCSSRAQFFETSQPIENLLTRATIDKIPVGHPDPNAHHVLMELPVVRLEPGEGDDYDFTEPPTLFLFESQTERSNPFVASGIFSPEQRQQRFKSLRPSSPFARRGGAFDSSIDTTTTPEPSSTTEFQGLRNGNIRSRFRFRPSLLSSKRKNEDIESPEQEKEEASIEETTTESSASKSKFSFRRTGGVSDFIRRNRPGLRRKSTTTIPETSPITTTMIPTTQILRTTNAPTTLWITSTENTKEDDLFSFDTPLTPFTKISSRDRTEIPFTTTPGSFPTEIPSTQSTTESPSPSSPTQKNVRKTLKRRRRPRPSVNIVPVTSEEEKALAVPSKAGSSSNLQFRGKQVQRQRIRTNRRRRPQTTAAPVEGSDELVEATTRAPIENQQEAEAPQTPTRKIRRERVHSRRQNARSDFEPLLLEETPRRSQIITQSSVKTERKIRLPLEEADQTSEIVRRDNNKNRLKTRRNVIRSNEIERYSFEEDDGSFTWGYKAKDGSFKEETRGIDCITRGRYGYIDDLGEVREYKYESGVPCKGNKNEEGRSITNLEERGVGYFDYSDNRFVLPDGRRVKVEINQKHRARG